MTISAWRWAHLWLAIISGVFIIIASITGAILSVEPVFEGSKGYNVAGADELTVAELTTTLTSKYNELLSIRRDPNGFMLVQTFGEEGETNFYVNPFSGDFIGEPIETPGIFDFSRTLHRSLFFGKFGRFLVGIASLLLTLMAFSGILLVAKKQGGLSNYFKKVIKEDFFQDYHTRLGKFLVFLLLVIGLTGTYLFLERFQLISVNEVEHHYDFEALRETPQLPKADFPVFKNHRVADLKELVFPFSEFVDDLYELKLSYKELLINQLTGEIVSEIRYNPTKKMSLLAFSWHTAEGQPWWAVLLGTSSLSLLFFMFTGFKISLNRLKRKAVIVNPISKEKASIVIGYGSEMGTTLQFAQALHQALLASEQPSYLVSLNDFEYLPLMDQLLILTSTYGTGGPPTNAVQFLKRLGSEVHQAPSFRFAVLGFGSTKYPDYCQYALEVDQRLAELPCTERLLALKTVNNGASEDFDQWINAYQETCNLTLSIKLDATNVPTVPLKVVEKRFSINSNDQTFLITFHAPAKQLRHLQSGDLLVVHPEEDRINRYYSMAVDTRSRKIALAVKRHEHGQVSNYLSQLNQHDVLNISFRKNDSFHFPASAKQVIMIANGTGIAPFLGMIAENNKKTPIILFWGGQNDASYQLYRSDLLYWIEQGKLKEVKTAFSRTVKNPKYVQDLLGLEKSLLIQCLAEEHTLMICGSLLMKEGVEAWLEELSMKHFNRPLDYYYERGLIKEDCY